MEGSLGWERTNIDRLQHLRRLDEDARMKVKFGALKVRERDEEISEEARFKKEILSFAVEQGHDEWQF